MKYILNPIDAFLNKTPMYRLVIYSLLAIVAVALVEAYFQIQSYSLYSEAVSLGLILLICLSVNYILAKTFKLPIQHESSLITALILFLILLPYENTTTLISIVVASIAAMASKYILVYRNTHIFNPAAVGIYTVTLFSFGTAYWWVGSIYTLPVVLLAGILVIRKTRRSALFFSGIFAGVIGAFISGYFYDTSYLTMLEYTFLSGPIIFFLTIMVTEPHTIAKNRAQQIFYAAFIILLPIVLSVTNVMDIPPELSLLIANFISLFISERKRYVLSLKEVVKLSDDMAEYIFEDRYKPLRTFKFKAGEFLEWNLYHKGADDRGIRRYFTISSAPGQQSLALATKYPPANDSTFKTALKNMQIGDIMYASQQGGDFILPASKYLGQNRNLILVAGGIGITPFISQLRDLLNKKERRNIVLFYCVRFQKDIVFVDLLRRAITEIGAKVVCVVSEDEQLPESVFNNIYYEKGYMSKDLLAKYTQNLFNVYYISGPNVMVEKLKEALFEAKVSGKDIHTDYFPGF